MDKDLNLSMSRKEAAEYIGVELQTISNWASQGILAFIDRGNCKLYSRTQIETMGEQLKDIASKQQLIDNLESETNERLKLARYKWSDVCKDEAITPAKMRKAYDRLSHAVTTIAASFNTAKGDIFSERELSVFEAFMNLEDPKDIAIQHGISVSTAMNLFNSVVNKLRRASEMAATLVQERDELQLKNDTVIKTISGQVKEKYEQEIADLKKKKIDANEAFSICFGADRLSLLQTPISRCPYYNGDIETSCHRWELRNGGYWNGVWREPGYTTQKPIKCIGELIAYSYEELLRRPRMTKSDLDGLKLWIESYGLTFGDKTYVLFCNKHKNKSWK